MGDRVGQQLGNYRLVRLLGMGSFAEVYQGEHIHLGTQAAIKVLRVQMKELDVGQFGKEARIIAGLIHPHIIRVLDYGFEGDDVPFLVMDYAPNGTLRHLHPRGAVVELSDVLAYVKQLASALQYAHDRKFVHRDVKPENILLGADSQVLLSDFGLALMARSSGSLSGKGMAGTPPYMAPEQLKGKPCLASDQYSLGIVTYEWLCGERPFTGSLYEIWSQHIYASPPSLCMKNQHISSEIERVVLKTLAKKPEERFTSVDAFAQAFEQACQPVVFSENTIQRELPPNVTSALSPEPLMDSVAQGNSPTLSQAADVASDNVLPSGVLASKRSASDPALPPSLPASSPDAPEKAHLDMLPTWIPQVVAQEGPVSQQLSTPPLIEVKDRKTHSLFPIPRLFSIKQWPVKKRSFMLWYPSLAVAVVVLLMAGLVASELLTAVTATVDIVPQVQTISRILTINAKPGITSIDTATSTIPISNLTLTESASQTGSTTGKQLECFFSSCPTVVSSTDVSNVGGQLKQQLITKLTQEMNAQVRTKNATALGDPTFNDVTSSYNPQIDEPSDTVTVNLTEQGTVNYYSNADMQTLVRQLLTQQAGAKYQMIDMFTRVGMPVVKGSDKKTGAVILSVPAAGVMKYNLSPSDLQNIQEHIRGMKIKDAQAFIAKLPGINTNAIVVKVSVGDTIPSDMRQINLVLVDPTNIPMVQLPKAN